MSFYIEGNEWMRRQIEAGSLGGLADFAYLYINKT